MADRVPVAVKHVQHWQLIAVGGRVGSPGRGIWVRVNQQDRQAIDDLFQHLNQSAAQAGPRDREAEARIRQHIQAGPPGLLYEMAQRLVGQQAALRQLRAQLDHCQQQLRQGGSPAGFAQPGWQGAAPQGYGGSGPPYQQRSGGQGFLAGAGQIALGVGGGILAADAIGSLLGGGGLFGDGRDEYIEQNVYVDQDDAGQGNNDGGRDGDDSGDGGYDDSGGYDGGGDFDDGGGFDGGDW